MELRPVQKCRNDAIFDAKIDSLTAYSFHNDDLSSRFVGSKDVLH